MLLQIAKRFVIAFLRFSLKPISIFRPLYARKAKLNRMSVKQGALLQVSLVLSLQARLGAGH